ARGVPAARPSTRGSIAQTRPSRRQRRGAITGSGKARGRRGKSRKGGLVSGRRPPSDLMETRGRVPRADRHEIHHELRSIDEFIHEYVTNVSRSGIFIRSKDPLPIGTRVALKFSIIVEDIQTIEGVGEVVRVTRSGMGVVFNELTDHSMDLLARLL